MAVPSPSQLIEQIRALPAAAPLLARLDDQPAVYLVGGAVRDLLLGERPLDLDLVVEGDPLVLARRLGGEIRAYTRFGTCTVSLNGAVYDLAGARRERYPRPGALPEVEPAPLTEDLARRDFTVNALATALSGGQAGKLVGVDAALTDLERGWLRVLHERSFIDDPTRLLRLARYAARLRFEPEPETAQLALTAARGGALDTVSGPRVGAELQLLAREPEALAALAWLHRLELDRAIHPGFGLADAELADRALALLPDDGRRDRLVLALASQAVARDELEALLDALAIPAADRAAIVATASGAPRVAERLRRARSASEIASAAANAPEELVALAGALGPQAQAATWLGQLRQVRLEIDGADLLAAGIPRGPAVGRGLRAALAAKLDGEVSSRDEELARALAAARGDGDG